METSTPHQREYSIKDKSIEQLRELVEIDSHLLSNGMTVFRSKLLEMQEEVRQRVPYISPSFSEQVEELTRLDQEITEALERDENHGTE